MIGPIPGTVINRRTCASWRASFITLRSSSLTCCPTALRASSSGLIAAISSGRPSINSSARTAKTLNLARPMTRPRFFRRPRTWFSRSRLILTSSARLASSALTEWLSTSLPHRRTSWSWNRGGVADVSEDQRGDDRTDPVQLEQRGRGRVDGVADPGLDRREVAIETAYIGEQLAGEALAFDARPDPRDARRGAVSRPDQRLNAGVHHRRRVRVTRRGVDTRPGCATTTRSS